MPHAARCPATRRPAALAAVSQLRIRACVQEPQPIWPPACERVVAASDWTEKRVWRRSWAALGCVLVRHWVLMPVACWGGAAARGAGNNSS